MQLRSRPAAIAPPTLQGGVPLPPATQAVANETQTTTSPGGSTADKRSTAVVDLLLQLDAAGQQPTERDRIALRRWISGCVAKNPTRVVVVGSCDPASRGERIRRVQVVHELLRSEGVAEARIRTTGAWIEAPGSEPSPVAADLVWLKVVGLQELGSAPHLIARCFPLSAD